MFVCDTIMIYKTVRKEKARKKSFMYSSSIKLILLLLTCLAGLALARPLKDIGGVTKRIRHPRHLRSSFIGTHSFSRRGVEDTFEPEADIAFAKKPSKDTNEKKTTVEAQSPNNKDKSEANSPSENKETAHGADDVDNALGNDKETVDTADNTLGNKKEVVDTADDKPSNGKEATSASNNEKEDVSDDQVVDDAADTNELDVNTEKTSAASAKKAAAVHKVEVKEEEDINEKDISEEFDAPFDKNVNPGADLVNKYKFRFYDTEPLNDGIEYLREQHQEGLQEEAEEAVEETAEEEAEEHAASLRAIRAQQIRATVSGKS